VAAIGAAAWLAGTTELTARRIAPGPKSAREIATMTATSTVLPAVASFARLRGALAARREPRRSPHHRHVDAVLFDRDGTLVVDVPYNRDPSLVVPFPTAAEAIDRLRRHGIATGVITNQSGIGRGVVAADDVAAVNARVESLLGPFDVWQVCPHAPEERCACRKPQPEMVLRATRALGTTVDRCVVIGDIASDVDAARAAGARGILVPNEATARSEVDCAEHVAPDLMAAVDMVLAFGARR
jgi:histidinol-phosphate phosphatase family protein